MLNKPLMSKEQANKLVYSNTNRSKVDDLSYGIYWGKEIHTKHYSGTDPTYWHYMDESVEDKIKDDRQYKVWYTYRDAADPADMTEVYCVYYIEEISPLKSAMIDLAEEFLRNL